MRQRAAGRCAAQQPAESPGTLFASRPHVTDAEAPRPRGGTPPLVAALAAVGAGFLGWLTLVAFFSPRKRYVLRHAPAPDTPEFVHLLEWLCPARLLDGNRVDVLKNGGTFYPAMIAALRAAEKTINIEAYVFKPGAVLDQFVAVLVDRARAGVEVTLVLDAIGAFRLDRADVHALRDAGCRLQFYDNPTWSLADRMNNRTHREIIVIDGRIGFLGGPGVADYWMLPDGEDPPWRDTSLRIEGPAIAALQGVFAENWLECSGEILSGEQNFPLTQGDAGDTRMMVVKSSPADRVTTARMLFHTFIACARTRLYACTPYFVPDRTMLQALEDAADRGVDVRLLTPGKHADQEVLHINSRRWFGELLKAGVRIFEYEPAMIHQKLLLVDDAWAVMGTTNLDNRSFELNDEINVAIANGDVVRQLERVFACDVDQSRELTYEEWANRPMIEKAAGRAAWVLDRQQ
jgi:cardiolipin synthase